MIAKSRKVLAKKHWFRLFSLCVCWRYISAMVSGEESNIRNYCQLPATRPPFDQQSFIGTVTLFFRGKYSKELGVIVVGKFCIKSTYHFIREKFLEAQNCRLFLKCNIRGIHTIMGQRMYQYVSTYILQK